ncbi:MAG: cysteine--tRNA ligase [Planctomycetota bacterium]
MATSDTVQVLYNTEARAAKPFVPADPARVTFYTCGPTVYDDAHVGNFRSFLVADVLRRWLESPLCTLRTESGDAHRGPRSVEHVMNITDVGHMTEDDDADGGGEDKMEAAAKRLLEAKKSGKTHESEGVDASDPRAIAAFYAKRFIDDATTLGLKVAIESWQRADVMPHASTHVETMIEQIKQLESRGFAYVRGDKGERAVYFDVSKLDDYGRLSGNTLDNLRGGAGGRVTEETQAQKNHPADFLLWKEDERHLMKWPSPWGTGYPGWHIECTAMSLEILDPKNERGEIDLHSGGEDNIFPHHECELAQARGVTGNARFARAWVHTRFLRVEGEKMSKSKGNFYTPRQLMADGHQPAAVRLELIKTHYRANADFSKQGLTDSARVIDRWRRFVEKGRASGTTGERNAEVADAFAAAMHNDLQVATAIGVINSWINSCDAPTRADAALLAGELDPVLGLLERDVIEAKQEGDVVWLPGVDPDPAIEQLVADRKTAKKSKDFARADAIRDEIQAKGLTIKDVAGGKVEIGRA